MTSTRWLFGDQLGPHFLDDASVDDTNSPVLLVESKQEFARRRIHRQKAHLVMSAMRHRAAELGDRCTYVRADSFVEGLAAVDGPITVVSPASRPALKLVQSLGERIELLEPRGFATRRHEFEAWAAGRGGPGARRLLMEEFYRDARQRFGLLMDGDEPVGGRWNLDHENRQPPPRPVKGADGPAVLDIPAPWWPEEDEIDAEVRRDLDAWEREGMEFVGRDGPRRFAVTRTEALQALEVFVTQRLVDFGPVEDAMLRADWTMAHSLLSPTMNLGLLHPLECARKAEEQFRNGTAPLQSVEGYIRQLVGWRDYVWHTYWHFGPDYRDSNALDAYTPLPQWFRDLEADAVEAACLRDVLTGVRDRGWVHHIPRLMVLGNYALQHGWDPDELTEWFHASFLDGYEWVMATNVVGMSQHADGGLMATKPYAAGGAYIHRMSDYCGVCPYDPKVRVGPAACPFTAGYWAFLARNESRLAQNHRMRQPLAGLHRLGDLDELLAQEHARADSAP